MSICANCGEVLRCPGCGRTVDTELRSTSAPDLAAVMKPFEHSRFGIFLPDGRFEELPKDVAQSWTQHPLAHTARWVGGPSDIETIRAAMLAAASPAGRGSDGVD